MDEAQLRAWLWILNKASEFASMGKSPQAIANGHLLKCIADAVKDAIVEIAGSKQQS